MNRLALTALLAPALLLAGCRKSDAERAAEERAALQKELTRSYTLVPYRLLKLSVRAEGTPGAPPELAAVAAQSARIGELGRRKDVAGGAEAVVRLAALAWQVRSLLDRHDEDEFPPLWTRFAGAPPAAWYDARAEHLALAFVLAFAQATATESAKQDDTALLTFAAYELSRAEPSAAWPRSARLVARLERGLLFCGNRRNYAAEEELNAYLAELDAPSAAVLAPYAGGKDPHLLARGVGRLLRGFNRLALRREDLALVDLDAGLRDLDGAGYETELTFWAWAVVQARRGQPAMAAASLDRLAQSAYLDEAARAEIGAAAAALRGSGKLPGPIAEARGLSLVARALVGRAGGMEAIVARAAGPEAAHRIFGPWGELVALQQQVARATDPAKLAGEAKRLGARWIEEAKARAPGGGGDPAKAGR